MYKNKKDKIKYMKRWHLEHRKKCPICGIKIDRRSKCCHSCAEKKYWEDHPEKRRKDKFCKICNKPLSKRNKRLLCLSHAIKQAYKEGKINQNGKNNSFFGKTHSKEYIEKLKYIMSKEGNPNWQEGKSFEPYSIDWTEELKERIRKRDNYECQHCGMTEEEHLIVYGRVLPIHHIDYNKKNCKESNLISLCLQCNSRANFNRNYWKEIFIKTIIKEK